MKSDKLMNSFAAKKKSTGEVLSTQAESISDSFVVAKQNVSSWKDKMKSKMQESWTSLGFAKDEQPEV